MRLVLASFSFFLLFALSSKAGTEVYSYNDFGPQVAVHEMIGYEWFQWNSHGDGNPESDREIKVVVYWNETLDEVKDRYPVDPSRLKDYRYLELETAIQHLRTLIPEFETSGLDTKALNATLETLIPLRKR